MRKNSYFIYFLYLFFAFPLSIYAQIDSTNYVTNAFTSQQFKLVDGEWVDTFQGMYDAGYWRLELLSKSDD